MGQTIDRRWLPLNALRAFEGVAQHGSFTAAANALRISQSALSRHVLGLEQLIGQPLFERRPHALVLTRIGQYLLPAVTKSFDRLERTIGEIRSENGPGVRTLRVQMSPSFAQRLAVPLLREFRGASAGVELDLVSPNAVAPMADVDLAVVYTRPTVTDLITDLLWPVRETILCHPQVAARHAGASLGDFIAANELVHVRIEGRPRHDVWAQYVRRNALPQLKVERGIVFDTSIMAVEYALSGEGLALADPQLFAEEIRSGRLVRPFAAELDDGYGYYLVTHPEGLGDAAIALFRSWLIERFGTQPAVAVGPGETAEEPRRIAAAGS